MVHLGMSLVWGVVFAVIVSNLEWSDDLRPSAGLRFAYGFGLWLVNIVFIWPLWLQAVGFPKAPTVPNVAVMPLVGHLIQERLGRISSTAQEIIGTVVDD